MDQFKRKFEDLSVKITQYFIGSDTPSSKKQIKLKKRINFFLILIIFAVGIIILLSFIESNDNAQKHSNHQDGNIDDSHQKIELGTDVTKADVKWQNFLEDSIEAEGKNRADQIALLQKTIDQQKESSNKNTQNEFKELKTRLSYALHQIDTLKAANQNIQDDLASLSLDDNEKIMPAELGVTSITTKNTIKAPISSFNHIPATSHVTGKLLGGIVVSTSMNSASEPIPVIIRIIDRGTLPKAFAVDITQCNILASCYGDISSERAIIRAEELVCSNPETSLITITKIAGIIYGDDGGNGIKGTIVSMSDKHLKNALIGGVLSGVAGTAKGKESFNVTALGAMSTQKQGIKDMLQDGMLSGSVTAAEKLADYHIKSAENISPVILIPGGTWLDVVFTKSVEIGSLDVEAVINSERE